MKPPEWLKKLAVPLANKIVYASDAYVGLKSVVNETAAEGIDFSEGPSGKTDERLHELASLLRPWAGDDLSLARVGGPSDGGYVMAVPIDVDCAISIGIGPDVSWDLEIAAMGIPVHMFDPTIKRLPQGVPGGHFYRAGIAGAEYRGNKYMSLAGLLELAHVSGLKEMILKVDVEGSEWHALAEDSGFSLACFQQVICEFHNISDLHDVSKARQMLQVLRFLRKSHTPIAVHANNYDRLVAFDRNWFPNSIEVTFIRKQLLTNPRPAEVVDLDLMARCDPRVSEIQMNGLLTVSPELA